MSMWLSPSICMHGADNRSGWVNALWPRAAAAGSRGRGHSGSIACAIPCAGCSQRSRSTRGRMGRPDVRASLADQFVVAMAHFRSEQVDAERPTRDARVQQRMADRARSRVHPGKAGRAAAALRAVPLRAPCRRARFEYGFTEITGLSPIAYVKSLRLNAVRRGSVAHRRCRALDLRDRPRPRVLAPQPVRRRLPQVFRRDADVDPTSGARALRASGLSGRRRLPYVTSATGRFFDSARRLHRVHCGRGSTVMTIWNSCRPVSKVGMSSDPTRSSPANRLGLDRGAAVQPRRFGVHAGRSVVIRGRRPRWKCLLLSLPEAAVRWLGQPISGNRFALRGPTRSRRPVPALRCHALCHHHRSARASRPRAHAVLTATSESIAALARLRPVCNGGA